MSEIDDMSINSSSIQLKKIINEVSSDTTYQCSTCKKHVLLNNKTIVMCNHCGSRILYKIRIKQCSEYLCR